MATVQRNIPHLHTAALTFIRKPTGALGVWDQSNVVFSGPTARYMGPAVGVAQVRAVPLFGAIPTATTHAVMVAQFLGDPLVRQTILAGTWHVAFAAQLANAGANFTWGGVAALFVVNGTTGQRRATLFDVTSVGSAARVSVTERTCIEDIAGSRVDVLTGDYLCLELGLSVANTAAALSPQASIFTDGTLPISADDVAATSALAVCESPSELALSLFFAGEPPDASVTQPQAVQIVKEHYPPYSASLYDWDNIDAVAYKLTQFLGDFVKLYGFDQTDRIFRELNPLTVTELLPAWESLLGITLTRAAQQTLSIDQRRAQMLARLREMGPLTLHNLAAIFAQLARYAIGTVPEVIEWSPAQLQAANEFAETIGTIIPVGSAFVDSNLVRRTPVILDGGEVWETGALVVISFDNLNTDRVHLRLMGPDYTVAEWSGAPELNTILYLRSPSFAGKAVHGVWQLNVYRDVGSPVNTVVSWKLYVLGRGHGGRASARYNWSVYLDPAHQNVDRREVDSTLARITQAYCQGWCVYDKTSIPGSFQHRPGRFLPGA